jgi:hypothetical protein
MGGIRGPVRIRNHLDQFSVRIEATAGNRPQGQSACERPSFAPQGNIPRELTNALNSQTVTATKCTVKVTRETCVSDQLFAFKAALDKKVSDNKKWRIACAVYLAAVGLAMMGWLWLIARCALQFL